MAKIMMTALDPPGIPPRELSPRLRSQMIYFVAASGPPGSPPAGDGEYWFDPDEVRRWVDDGVFYLVSPLDTANTTEVELTEEQEELLGWVRANGVRRVRVDE